MVFQVTLSIDVYVSVDSGDAAVVSDLVRDRIAAGPCLFSTEGVDKRTGHYLAKGMSAAVADVRPFSGNPNVSEREEEGS